MKKELDFFKNVFINCPFDKNHQELLFVLIFTILNCGFTPRCALEMDDGGEVRINKIIKIISECKFGIHDISFTELDQNTNLPRFNMPFELGIFFGAKNFGGKFQKQKTLLIFDKEDYRYQSFIFDIAGQDIKNHQNNIQKVIEHVRNWLNSYSAALIPSGKKIFEKFNLYFYDIPKVCVELQVEPNSLTYHDFGKLTRQWLKQNSYHQQTNLSCA